MSAEEVLEMNENGNLKLQLFLSILHICLLLDNYAILPDVLKWKSNIIIENGILFSQNCIKYFLHSIICI